jgi:hypothetical protein
MAAQSDHFEAWVRRGAHDTPLPCTVMNMRPEGATLFSPEIALPDKFTLLLLPDGSISRDCKAVSRQAYTIAVEFIESDRA